MKHDYENNIKCPYCDWEDQDSWEFDQDDGTHTCGSCEKEFNVTRDIEITYSTSRISCEENHASHDYKFESTFISKKNYNKGVWTDLPSSEWAYKKILECSICGDKEYIAITKEEYEKQENI